MAEFTFIHRFIFSAYVRVEGGGGKFMLIHRFIFSAYVRPEGGKKSLFDFDVRQIEKAVKISHPKYQFNSHCYHHFYTYTKFKHNAIDCS